MRVRGAAEERGDGQPRDLADDVPQGHLERPVPAGVEVDRLDRPDVASDGQRVPADEQVLERVEAIHRVARADPHDALVGLDPDDRGREGPARDRVPRGREGRVQRHDQSLASDRGDTHERSIAVHRVRRREAVIPTRTMDHPLSSHRTVPEVPTMTIDPRRAATVDFDHVSKSYDKPKNKKEAAKLKDQPGAVNDLSLRVPAGKICVLVGPSGCGKTTSLKMVNRLIEPTVGTDPARRRGRRDARRDRAPPRDRLRHPADRPVPAPDDHRERRDRAAPARLAEGAPRTPAPRS